MIGDRTDFPLLAANPGLHYLDSAATTQKPRAVLDAMIEYYTRDNANPHRGAYALSARATERYHDARRRIARFIGVKDADRVIFTRGTTESLNLVATAWGRANVGAGDEIVVTGLEHHANFVPWQQLANDVGARLRIARITPGGCVDVEHFASLVGPRTKVVAFAHVSNALGTINQVAELSAIARKVGAVVVCDGAQGAPHFPLAIDQLDVDFYAFSGHKMLGPMGCGVLVGKRDLLEAMPPYQTGGDMIEYVGDERTTWNVLPHKFEAGTPNVGDAVGLAAACDYLAAIGMDTVREHERAVTALATSKLSKVTGVRILGPSPEGRSGVVSFTVGGIHPHDLATILDEDGVCIRAGHHCAQPLMRRLEVPATARASFYIYNDEADVDALVAGVERARDVFGGGDDDDAGGVLGQHGHAGLVGGAIRETAAASIDLAVGRSLRATLTLENDSTPVNLIWGNDCSGFGDAITVRAYKHGSSVVAWSSDRLPNALLCPTVAHTRTLGTGETLQLNFVAGVDRVLGDSLPGGTYDITVTPRVVGVDGDENTAGSLTLATGVVAPNGTPLDGTWTGSSRGVTVSFDLHWSADSVFGTGTWSVTGANTLGCGGGTLTGNGTVALAAHRTGDQIGGSTQFSNGWTPPFLGVLADPNSLGAHFMSVDAGPCPITLVRK